MARLATVAAFGFTDFNPPTLLSVYKKLGCDSLQFYRNVKNPPTVAEALTVSRELGMPFDSIHGVFGPEHDPSSLDDPTREAAIETYREEGILARDLGGPAVVVHPAPMCPDPRLNTAQGRIQREAPLLRSMEQLARMGEELGVVYLIENIPGNYFFGSDARQLASMVRGFDSPNLRMCFDTGHAHMSTTTSAAEDLAACLDVVAYFHINDNDRKLDAHLIPGRGTIDWPAVAAQMALLPAGTSAMLELFNLEPEMVRQLESGLGNSLRNWLAIGRGI